MKRVKAWPSLELLRLMVLISAFEMGGTHFHSTHRSILLDLFLATPSPWVGLKQFPYRSDGKYKCSATMGKYSSATHQTFNWWHTTCRWALAGSKWNLLTTNRIKVRAINDGTINLYILTRFWNGFASDSRNKQLVFMQKCIWWPLLFFGEKIMVSFIFPLFLRKCYKKRPHDEAKTIGL